MNELVGAVLTRPSIDTDRAAAILREQWGIGGDLRSLPSERDQNFAVSVDGRDRFVLKLSNATEDVAFLDLQHRAMARLVVAGVPCQVPVITIDGREMFDVGPDGSPTLARLLTWLPGRPLATIPPGQRSDELLADLGRVMGRTATALGTFDHPAAHREFQWEAEHGLAVIATHRPAVANPSRAVLLARWVGRLASLQGVLPALRHGVIHNDANDHNVLVDDGAEQIAGLLDFGDAVHSVVANELAVAAAYAALATDDPLAIIAAIREGFEETCPLRSDERAVLVELVALRLATSVALSAHQSRLDPDDAYLTVSEAPAWALLEDLIAIDPAKAAARVAEDGR
ncbi:MAG TPA: phosphotransferase [Candidatus Limnocylindrales bacterium]|nr:phosphotransferase [Candidatus Limnocylindrales bacterium]